MAFELLECGCSLLGFGHAQFIQDACGYRATKGFEAPEIMAGYPHSRESDAFSVGATILAEMDRLGVEGGHWLRSLCLQLTAPSSLGRIDLEKAQTLVERSLNLRLSMGSCHSHVKKPRLAIEAM